jgi:hypothetical protein
MLAEPVRLAYPKLGYLKVVVKIEVLVPWENLTYAGGVAIKHKLC